MVTSKGFKAGGESLVVLVVEVVVEDVVLLVVVELVDS